MAQHVLEQGAGGVAVVDGQSLHVSGAVGVGPKRLVAVPLDPLPHVRVHVVVDVVVPRRPRVGVQIAEQHVQRRRPKKTVHVHPEIDACRKCICGRVVDEVEERHQIAPIVRVFVAFQLVKFLVGGLIVAVVDEVGFRTATSAARSTSTEVVARLEQVAAVLLDVPIEELIVNLFHHGVESPGLAVERHVGEAGPWRRDAHLATHVEKQLFAHAGRVLEAVAEVEFLEPVVVLSRDELVEVDFEGLLVARVHVARIALQPNPHAVHDVRATHVHQGQMRGDVLVLVRLVVGLQQRPKVRLRKREVNGDDLIDREDVVAVDLANQP